VSFKAYSKRIKSFNDYQLFPQIRRTQVWTIPPATTSGTGARLDPGKTFYMATVHVDYYNSTGAPITIYLIDGATTDKIRASFVINNDAGHFDIDYSVCPADFLRDNISIVISGALAAGNYAKISMIGWAE